MAEKKRGRTGGTAPVRPMNEPAALPTGGNTAAETLPEKTMQKETNVTPSQVLRTETPLRE